jgi:hypothetical protein
MTCAELQRSWPISARLGLTAVSVCLFQWAAISTRLGWVACYMGRIVPVKKGPFLPPCSVSLCYVKVRPCIPKLFFFSGKMSLLTLLKTTSNRFSEVI